MSIMSKPDHWIKKILVATPIMGRDSTFHKSVILLYEESVQHIAGLVLNKPIETMSINELFESSNLNPPDEMKEKEITVYWGGPVNPQHIFFIHQESKLHQVEVV